VAREAEVERITKARIQRARETLAALDRVLGERTAESVAALHEIHARHLRELGDEDGAERAHERALHATDARANLRGTSPDDAIDERSYYPVVCIRGQATAARRSDGLSPGLELGVR
jgi:hypothetical protein